MAKFKAGDKVVRTGPDTEWWTRFCAKTDCDSKQVFVVTDTIPQTFVGYESFSFDEEFYSFAPEPKSEPTYTVEQVIRAYVGSDVSESWIKATSSIVEKRLKLNSIKDSVEYKQYLELKEKFKDIA